MLTWQLSQRDRESCSLTMWDVNLVVCLICACKAHRCSLTMWDVNVGKIKGIRKMKQLFFNYVGCKYSSPGGIAPPGHLVVL